MQRKSNIPKMPITDDRKTLSTSHPRSGLAYLATLAEILLIVAMACTAFVFIRTILLPVKSQSPAVAAPALNSIKRLFATEDGQIWIRRGSSEILRFNPDDQTSRSVFSWNDRPVSELYVSDDGRTLVVSIEEREIMIFRDEKLIVSEELPPHLPARTAISGDGQVVVRSNEGTSYRYWDLSSSDPTNCDLQLTEAADRISLDQHGTRLLVASTLGNLQIYDAKTGTLVQSLLDVGALSAPAQLTSDGRYIAAVSGQSISLYSVSSGRLKWRMTACDPDYLREFVISPDDRWIAVCGIASPIYLLDCETGKVLRRYVHRQNFSGVSFSPQEDIIYSGGLDGSICVWSIHDDRLIRTIGETQRSN